MKLINYVGCEGPCLTIESPEDLYCILEYVNTCMIELHEETNDDKFDKCADFICTLMDQTEKAGFGSYENVEEIDYGF